MTAEHSTGESVLGRKSCRSVVAAVLTAAATVTTIWFLRSAPRKYGGGDWGGFGMELLIMHVSFWGTVAVGLLSVIGVCYGVAGIYQAPGRSKSAIVGAILNSLLLIAAVCVVAWFVRIVCGL